MSDIVPKLQNAPIIEAVVDIECDMPPMVDLAAMEKSAQDAYGEQYPEFHRVYIDELQIKRAAEIPLTHKVTRGILAFQFLQQDKKQLLQVRLNGYSFNRLAPYSTLDEYLPEIARTWKLFVGFARPTLIRAIRLRYINRILLPMDGANVGLEKYLKIAPKLLDESNLTFVGFLNQYTAVETGTGNQANIVLTTQPVEAGKRPIILDIGVVDGAEMEIDNWVRIAERIQLLRNLKNRIFLHTLTETCLNLFQRSG